MVKKYLTVGILLATVLIAAVAVARMTFKRVPDRAGEAAAGREAGLKAKGPDDAPVRIIEFSDFQCGACRRGHPFLDALAKDYPGQIQIIFKHFPLLGRRGPNWAHRAAECAHREGVFWPYMERLFHDQAEWMPAPNPADRLLHYAAALNLNVDAFAACLVDEKVYGRVMADHAEGEALRVRSTPTFFVGEERMVGLAELERRAVPAVRRQLGLAPLPESAPAVAGPARDAPIFTPAVQPPVPPSDENK
jgi:protein-disulfide isomerase